MVDEALDLLRGRAGLAAASAAAVLPGRLVLVEMLWWVVSLPQDLALGDYAAGLRYRALVWLPLWWFGLVVRQVVATALTRRAAVGWPEPGAVVGHLAVVTTLSLVLWISLPSVLLPLLILPLVVLAASTPGTNPWRSLGQATQTWPLRLVGMVFLVATGLATVNVAMTGHLLVALAQPLLTTSEGLRAEAALESPLAWYLAAALGSAVIEPAWTAAGVVLARRARARRTGEDLRARLEALS